MQLHGHHTFVVITPRDVAPTDIFNLVHQIQVEKGFLPIYECRIVLTETLMYPEFYFITRVACADDNLVVASIEQRKSLLGWWTFVKIGIHILIGSRKFHREATCSV
jgi:hypothetical protein